ncbi:MAG TPA: ABC-type transport auxiliary lipoprotein family protein [Ramlibacter sp.]|nr:ABC-type transport auxiliary lipoprotein family protein [Ramlibacter sp.]
MIAQRLWMVAAAFALGACSSIAPDKPVRATMYDFGPGAADTAAPATPQPAIVLADLESSTALESSALLYRLGYADAHQLLPYAHARWSAPPPQLVRQRLRERLGRDRAVLDPTEAATLARTAGQMPRVLRVELEEFSHVFDSATQSFGVVRVRATLLDNTPGGERLIGQRVFAQRQPAAAADASGGVRAITAATDAVAQDISAWLAQMR